MNIESLRLDAGGFEIAGLMVDRPESDKPLLVCIPGGSYTSAYFNVPGYSLIEVASANRFPVAALDRPNYGGSDRIDGETSFAANAEILDGAIAALWERAPGSCPGIVLLGHSIGGAISLMIAARQPAWPLLGVSATGIGDVVPDSIASTRRSTPPGELRAIPQDIRRAAMYGPETTFDPQVVDAAEISTAPMPGEEVLEVIGGWVESFPAIAAEVRVPVHYVAPQHDGLWVVDPHTVAAFAARFEKSPFVKADLFRHVGHNIDHHLLGSALHFEQLAFALRCVAERS